MGGREQLAGGKGHGEPGGVGAQARESAPARAVTGEARGKAAGDRTGGGHRPLSRSPWGDRRFVCRACQVPEPEERFAMDEYADMVAVAKPVAYVTVGELVNTHRVRAAARGAG